MNGGRVSGLTCPGTLENFLNEGEGVNDVDTQKSSRYLVPYDQYVKSSSGHLVLSLEIRRRQSGWPVVNKKTSADHQYVVDDLGPSSQYDWYRD